MTMQTLEKPTQREDDVLIRDTLAGHREAFGTLIGKYKDSLYDLACRVLGNAQEAEDVLQDALLEAYRHLASFKHESRFSTWVYSIVLNRARNRLRHKKTIRWQSFDAPPTQDPEAAPIEFPDRSPSVQDITENRMTLETVQKAVETLPFEYQSIFVLHYMQNWPILEIAEVLKRPAGTVKVYLHRARKLLYKRLGAQGLTM
jgi:RNA polymerase sigma-70 factor (ECF subfamily)